MDPPATSAPAPAPDPQPANPSPEPPAKRSPEEVAQEVLESRSVQVFRPSQERFDPRRIQLPDDFFEPSVQEMSAAANSLTSGVHRLNDAPLMTKKMRDAHAEKRMSRFRKVLIRILFPDRVALQGIFEPKSTVRQVQRFVRAALRDARNVRFHLFLVPPKEKLEQLDVTLWSKGLVPAALVHIGIDEGPKEGRLLLKQSLVDIMEDTPLLAAPAPPPAPPVDEVKPEPASKPKKNSGLTKKLPKWFKK